MVNRLGGVEALLMNGVTPIGLGTELATDAPTGQGLLYVGPGAVLADDPIGVLSGARSLSKYRSEVGSTTPIPVAAVATREDGSPRIVAVGDSDWLLNSALPYYSNRSFLLNSVHWLLGNSWALAERDRTELSSTVALSDDDLKLAMALMVLSAQLLLLMGLVAVYRRRVGEQCS